MTDAKRPEAPLSDPRWTIFGLACAVFCCFVAFIVGYARFGGSFVEGLERSIGEVMLDEGIRLEYAKEYENAVQVYRQAVERRFDHPANKTEALRRLGTLLWWREGAEEGLPYLEAAHRNGDFTIWLYEPLCSALLDVGRDGEALEHVQAWLDRAANEGRSDHQERAQALLRRIQEEAGF